MLAAFFHKAADTAADTAIVCINMVEVPACGNAQKERNEVRSVEEEDQPGSLRLGTIGETSRSMRLITKTTCMPSSHEYEREKGA